MKPLFYTKTLIALAAAVAAATANISRAQENPIPPPTANLSAAPALPPGIEAGTPLAQILKLVQAGTDISVINNYITNVSTPFGLDADKIIALTDAGVPAEVLNTILAREKILFAANTAPTTPPAPTAAPVTIVSRPAEPAPGVAPPPAPAPPTTQVTINYFQETLSPYGSWVDVDGYGRCWRPTVVRYDSGWRPYCDRGRWVYTDCGWYWDSDYAWGVTFQYGRWFRHDRFGWCWYPDTVWAPSWVSWRQCDDYYGWAPLPPLAVYRPGVGFFYRGTSVSWGFDFGLSMNCFTFVTRRDFNMHNPRRHCVEPSRVTQIFNQTTVINNYNVNQNTVVNNGIAINQINRDRTPDRVIQPVPVSSLPNSPRHNWNSRKDRNDRNGPGRNDRTRSDDGTARLTPGGTDTASAVNGTPVAANSNTSRNVRQNEDDQTRHNTPRQNSTRSGWNRDREPNQVAPIVRSTPALPPATSAAPVVASPTPNVGNVNPRFTRTGEDDRTRDQSPRRNWNSQRTDNNATPIVRSTPATPPNTPTVSPVVRTPQFNSPGNPRNSRSMEDDQIRNNSQRNNWNDQRRDNPVFQPAQPAAPAQNFAGNSQPRNNWRTEPRNETRDSFAANNPAPSIRSSAPSAPPQNFNAPSAPRSDWRSERRVETPAVSSAPAIRAPAPVETRQFSAPSAPSIPDRNSGGSDKKPGREDRNSRDGWSR